MTIKCNKCNNAAQYALAGAVIYYEVCESGELGEYEREVEQADFFCFRHAKDSECPNVANGKDVAFNQDELLMSPEERERQLKNYGPDWEERYLKWFDLRHLPTKEELDEAQKRSPDDWSDVRLFQELTDIQNEKEAK